MKVRVPVMIQDPVIADFKGMKLTEGFDIEDEDVFLDGPVSRRVAVLDIDAETGALRPGAPFQPPAAGRLLGRYRIADEADISARDFNQVSVFGTVLRTMSMFEEPDTLGRPLRWAFDAPQLLVIPRAGQLANAYYERDSHSLQFFYFPSRRDPSRTVYTSLSHDIVSHETGHAILDGIAPDLYNAITPQALALHEGIADLSALVMAFRSHTLRETVLGQTNGSIRDSSAFSALAEEFGSARDLQGRAHSLRSLRNDRTLDPHDRTVDELGEPNLVPGDEPHRLSEVLSGTLYGVMVRIHEDLKQRYDGAEARDTFRVSGKALADGVNRFKRMVFRGLDYLPPGEVSFADYGRAVIAADQASHPDHGQERRWICEEFVRRAIAPNQAGLEVETDVEYVPLQAIDLQTLVDSDWAAYEFANQNREFLGIPPNIHFRVRPRLDVTKLTYQGDKGERKTRECLLKVSWDHKEENNFDRRFPPERQVTVGTTLAIDWESRRVRAKLTSGFGAQQAERDRLLGRLLDQGLLQLGRQALGPDGKPLRSAVRVESMDGLMRVRGAARMLHIARLSP
jgi:hypothetical protein